MKPKNPVLQNTSPDFQGKKKTKNKKPQVNRHVLLNTGLLQKHMGD